MPFYTFYATPEELATNTKAELFETILRRHYHYVTRQQDFSITVGEQFSILMWPTIAIEHDSGIFQEMGQIVSSILEKDKQKILNAVNGREDIISFIPEGLHWFYSLETRTYKGKIINQRAVALNDKKNAPFSSALLLQWIAMARLGILTIDEVEELVNDIMLHVGDNARPIFKENAFIIYAYLDYHLPDPRWKKLLAHYLQSSNQGWPSMVALELAEDMYFSQSFLLHVASIYEEMRNMIHTGVSSTYFTLLDFIFNSKEEIPSYLKKIDINATTTHLRIDLLRGKMTDEIATLDDIAKIHGYETIEEYVDVLFNSNSAYLNL